jgi:hypothetical protein
VEVTATPTTNIVSGPRIYVPEGDALAEIPAARAGSSSSWQPRVANATGTVRWALLDAQDQPQAPPAGLSFSTNSGALSGTPSNTPPATWLRFRVTAGNGSDTRDFLLNPPAWTATGSTNRPPPPQNVQATAGNGFVRLTWEASPATNIVAYRIFRSTLPRAQQANRVYLEGADPAPLKDDYLIFDKRMLQLESAWSHPRVRDINSRISQPWSVGGGAMDVSLTRVAHPGPVPTAFRFPGETCLLIQASNAGSRYVSGPAILYPVKDDGEALWYGQLEPGKTYRYEAWLRQEGLGSTGRVTLGFHQIYTSLKQTFAVTNQWQPFGFEFTAPAPPTSGWHGMPRLDFTGPGRLWVDNIRLFCFDTPAEREADFVPSRLVFDELMNAQPPDGPKGMLRSMGVMLNSSTMKGILNFHRDSGATFDWYQAVNAAGNMTLPFFLDYAFRTGDRPATRMTPWLNVASFTTEAEWLALIEFLGATIDPNDPADVAAKPWAYLRYQQRGVTTPWADEFPRILLEFANETWHNRASPGTLYWWGWGQAGAVHQGGQEFGLWARYVTDYVAHNSPHWVARGLDGKLQFVMGSNYQDYAEKGRPLAPRVKGIGHAPYVGPKWETGEQPNQVFDDHGIQGTLLGYIAGTAADLDKYRRQRETLAAQGALFEMLGYESGPSGYSLPGSAPEWQVEISEQYGKSLAMAVAALDAWLGSHEAGMTERGQLAFSQGRYWSSHTLAKDGFRPHAHWLALKMRNRLASGQMIRTVATRMPTLPWNNVERPLVGCYAFRDGAKLSVFALSRKLGGVHDGRDFGDGSTPVTLNLPGNPVGLATLYTLTGDPRTNNRTAMVLTIQTQQVAVTRSHTFSLPQGSIYLFVVHTDLPHAGAAPATPENFQVNFAPEGAVLSWTPVPGATGYRVYRGTNSTFSVPTATAEFSVLESPWTDPAAGPASVNYYRIAAFNDFGEGVPSLVALGGTNQFLPPPPETVTLVPAGSTWKYFDLGRLPAANWMAPEFNDATWASGPAPLGYGGNGEVTTVSYGTNANAKHITTYFRRVFTVAGAASFTNAALALLRDDGAVVYLNGAELFRSNMPQGPIGYSTLATNSVGGTDEQRFFTNALTPAWLREGTNLLAVEVHQVSASSSDLGFDLALVGLRPAVPPPLGATRLAGAGGLQLSFLAAAGHPYSLQASTNLTQWSTVTNLLGAGALALMSFPVEAAIPARFFRLRSP